MAETTVESTNHHGLLDAPQGLRSPIAIVSLVIWYVSSAAVLFTNKYILTTFQGDAFCLGKLNADVQSMCSTYFSHD